MIAKSILLLASAALSVASPVAQPDSQPISADGCAAPQAPTLPVNGGPSELPQPPAGLKLQRIALGLGTQNYTCSHPGADPVSTGALAMFYDITSLFPGQSQASLSQSAVDALPAFAVNNLRIPLNFDPVPGDKFACSLTSPFPADAPLRFSSCDDPAPLLGHHFFDADGTPVFDLPAANIHLVAKKDASADAPAAADKGPEGTGAVAWLKLSAKDGAGSFGASLVYRVETAGGNPHGCSNGTTVDSTPYSAQYWFFG
ncbi:hypothetical protein ESCO_003497 [Escovopsis weberi]|uniref:Malate dehydrogenase n=1 Tax=Escovopsis weberi TaxID=150374 RepID=A0A0M8N0R1_ESCWE|nr:hypothetical protein ESCO_003497 [Escovopsis weberi]